ncbi:MAG: hypothetical protein AB1627_08870 [Chloroflexota bacterium]
MGLSIERIVHFGPDDLVRDGFVHFGFHDRTGRQYLVEHQRHFIGLVAANGGFEWTIASSPVFPGVPNVAATLNYPGYVDSLPDGSLLVSNFGNAHLYRIDLGRMSAELLVDGHAAGLVDMGNCVVDDDGFIWVNEVTGCRVWRFDGAGRVVLVLGDGRPGFQRDTSTFEAVRFNWIYDLRRGPDGTLFVLDSKNFALRMIDIDAQSVVTVAGTGTAGYSGDGGHAREATIGSDPTAKFDGPFSLSLDEVGNAYVGDRYNHVVRMIAADTGMITTIAGRRAADNERANDPGERDPMRLNLPQISSMDYSGGRLFVPTDLDGGHGDLVVLQVG